MALERTGRRRAGVVKRGRGPIRQRRPVAPRVRPPRPSVANTLLGMVQDMRPAMGGMTPLGVATAVPAPSVPAVPTLPGTTVPPMPSSQRKRPKRMRRRVTRTEARGRRGRARR